LGRKKKGSRRLSLSRTEQIRAYVRLGEGVARDGKRLLVIEQRRPAVDDRRLADEGPDPFITALGANRHGSDLQEDSGSSEASSQAADLSISTPWQGPISQLK